MKNFHENLMVLGYSSKKSQNHGIPCGFFSRTRNGNISILDNYLSIGLAIVFMQIFHVSFSFSCITLIGPIGNVF
jgi:hypothetical protein